MHIDALAALHKWLWCSWRHRKYRCYPTVWGPEQAAEIGIPYRPNAWHCMKCHPCGEWMDNLTMSEPSQNKNYDDG